MDERPDWQVRIGEQWEQVKPRPFRLTREVLPRVFQVRTRGSRVHLLIDDRITIIDCGNIGSGSRILAALEELGRRPEEVHQIVITHSHVDHIGALPELQRCFPARTAVHLLDAPLVTSAERLPNPSQHPLVARIVDPWLQRLDPGAARVDIILRDGDELPVLGGMRVVHAPGHTPGSISLHLPQLGLLIVGDALQHKFGRLLLPSRLWTEDMEAAKESVHKLAMLDFDAVCFAHFRPILSDAGRRVRQLSAALSA